VLARGKDVELGDATHNLDLNETGLARPNKPDSEAGEEVRR